jgi:predicted transcriptional regulator
VNVLKKHLEMRTFLDLLEDKGKAKLATVNHNESVENAIRLMLKKEYSQLPVMKGDKAVGVISYESLAKTIYNFAESKSKPPAKVRVKDCIEKVSKVFSAEDDVIDLINALAEKSYVLISKRSKVTDIITSYDALWFFRTYGERFLSSTFEKGEF